MRYWTEDEAREYLPRARQLLGVIREAGERAARARSNGHAPVRSASEPEALRPEGRSQRDAGPGEASGGQLPDARGALAELAAASIVLRDPASGLIDFPAIGDDGVVYLLCWRDEDGDLGWWHLPEEGFAGRKRLPRGEPRRS